MISIENIELALRPKKQEFIPLDDLTKALVGSYIGRKEIRGADDAEPVYKVYYSTHPGALQLLKRWSKVLAPERLIDSMSVVHEHPLQFPESGMKEVYTPDSDEPGHVPKKMRLIRSVNGNQEYANTVDEQIGQDLRATKKQLQQKEAENWAERSQNASWTDDESGNDGGSPGSL